MWSPRSHNEGARVPVDMRYNKVVASRRFYFFGFIFVPPSCVQVAGPLQKLRFRIPVLWAIDNLLPPLSIALHVDHSRRYNPSDNEVYTTRPLPAEGLIYVYRA